MSYRIVLVDRVPTWTDEEGTEHLRARMVVLRETVDGIYLHVTPHADLSGVTVTEVGEANDQPSFRALPAAHKSKLVQAAVYRRTDGQSLRAQVEADEGVSVGRGVPQSGRTSTQPADAQAAEKALSRARALAADPDAPVERDRVFADEVQDGDVVEEDEMHPHEWANSA